MTYMNLYICKRGIFDMGRIYRMDPTKFTSLAISTDCKRAIKKMADANHRSMSKQIEWFVAQHQQE